MGRLLNLRVRHERLERGSVSEMEMLRQPSESRSKRPDGCLQTCAILFGDEATHCGGCRDYRCSAGTVRVVSARGNQTMAGV